MIVATPGQAATRLDPRTHLLFAIALLVHLFRWQRPASLALLATAWLVYVALHRLAPLPFLRLLRFLRWLLLVAAALHLFMTPGHVVWQLPATDLWLTREGITIALLTVARLTLAVWIANALYRCLTPEALVAGLLRLLGPLGHRGRRAHRFAVVTGLAIGFLPWFAAQFKEWREQRGVDFDTRLTRLVTAGHEEIATRAEAASRGELPDPTDHAAALRLRAVDTLFLLTSAAILAAGWVLEVH
ncbi:MAG: CbiQ family ECF transporter T component [Nitrospirota bacterium]